MSTRTEFFEVWYEENGDHVEKVDYKAWCSYAFDGGFEAATSQQAERIAQLELALKQKDEALKEVDRQLETGFVRCKTCGDQEDTKDFDCRTWIADALSIQPSQEALDALFMSRLELIGYCKGSLIFSLDDNNNDTDFSAFGFTPLYRLKDK